MIPGPARYTQTAANVRRTSGDFGVSAAPISRQFFPRRGRVMSEEPAPAPWLVADIGATNARFGLMSRERRLLYTQTYPCAEYRAIEDAA